MFDVILGSGEQKSIFISIFVHFKTIFHTNLKNMALSEGGTLRLRKDLPYAKIFFLCLTDDILIKCNLQLIKNNRNTNYSMHFEKKLPKKDSVYISGYLPISLSTHIFPATKG